MNNNWITIERLIDPGTFTGAVVLAVVVIILAWVACMITTILLERSGRIMERQRKDAAMSRYIIRVKNFILCISLFFFYVSLIPGLKTLVGTMIAGAGFTAIVVGFAAKSTISNLIAGLSIAIYRPVRIGDRISFEGEYCTVEEITMRHTIVRTLQYKRIIIPNSRLDEITVINYSIIDPRMICVVELGVSRDTDIDLARRLIIEECHRCPYRDQSADDPLMRGDLT